MAGTTLPEPSDTEVAKDMAAHDAYEIARRLYELYPPQDADWLLTVAKIAADQEYRRKQSNER